MLTGAAGGTLGSALLLLLVPKIEILLFEILTAMIMLACAYGIRRGERAAAQLCLDLEDRGGRLRLPGRYELLLIILVILGYGAIGSALRSLKTPEILVRAAPLLLFAVGLVVKDHILRGTAALISTWRERSVRPKTRTTRLRGMKSRQKQGSIESEAMAMQSVKHFRVESGRKH
jgi:hypothetical protein